MKIFGLLGSASLLIACADSSSNDGPPPETLRHVQFNLAPSAATLEGIGVTADGWSVQFERATVMVVGPSVQNQQGVRFSDESPSLVDALAPPPRDLGLLRLEVGSWSNFEWELRPAEGVLVRNVPNADASRFSDAGASVWIAGAAQKGEERVSFSWLLSARKSYQRCNFAADGVLEVGPPPKLPAGETDASLRDLHLDITLHAERLLRDDLQSEAATYRFEPFAEADADGDGEVTLAELESVSLAELEGAYSTGDTAAPTTLRAYLDAALGHLLQPGGGGSCSRE